MEIKYRADPKNIKLSTGDLHQSVIKQIGTIKNSHINISTEDHVIRLHMYALFEHSIHQNTCILSLQLITDTFTVQVSYVCEYWWDFNLNGDPIHR